MSSQPTVHARGEARLDAMLDLTEEASRAAPLDEVLAAMAGRIAQLLAVDVCSIYLRDAQSLVLRATHGYPQSAVGRVRMAIGEGLTGFAVECLRPVSVAQAKFDARNRLFPELDEERFPSLCALPLTDGGRAVGALVIQRARPRAFGPREVVLAASVATPILFALERARLYTQEQASAARLRASDAEGRGARPREVALHGTGLAPGAALGTVVLRRAVKPEAAERGGEVAVDVELARLGRAVAEAAEELAALESWARVSTEVGARLAALLAPARFVLDDARLRGRMKRHVNKGDSAERAVQRTLAEYSRTLTESGDEVLRDRAVEVEALCLRVLGQLGTPAAPLPPGAVLCATRLTVCDTLELARAHGSAALLAGSEAGTGVELARALGLPVVGGVGELYRWVADGDRALVDGAAGSVLINPSRLDETAFRRR